MIYSGYSKGKNGQPRILCLAKLFFKNEGDMKSFLDKQKLTGFVTARAVLQEMPDTYLSMKYV